MSDDGPRYARYGKGSNKPVLKLSEYENNLYQANLDQERQYLYHLQVLIATSPTEHLAMQLIPIYDQIRSATRVDQLTDLTMHERSVVRIAATQKIEMLTGQHPKSESIDQGYARWSGNSWHAPRKPS